MKTEIYKDIIGYEGIYQISNLGNVKSLHKGKEYIMKLLSDKYGYSIIHLSKNDKRKKYSIHRLIAIHFISNPENKETVNHINGIKTDNRIENLEWNTQKENNIHKYKVLNYKGSMFNKLGINNHSSKKVNQYSKNNELIKSWDCISDVKRELNINRTTISWCCKGKRKTAGGFIWKYV